MSAATRAWRAEWTAFRRSARNRGPLWFVGQALLTAITLGLLALVLHASALWVLESARWEVVSENLRLFAVGRYLATPAPGAIGAALLGQAGASGVWRPAAALVVLAAGFGLADGLGGRRGTSVFMAKALAAMLALPLAAPALAPFSPSLAGLLAAFAAGRARFVVALSALAIGWLAGRGIRSRATGSKAGPVGRAERRLRIAGALAWAGAVGGAVLFVAGAEPLLEVVPSGRWGGLLLTLILAGASIALSFPIGVLLALGRRSRLPLVRLLSVAYIELIRGVPLVTVLYMASLMLPLVLGQAIRPPDVLKGIAGLTAFAAAYVAEDVRGGLAAVGVGQYEAARAVGLGTFGTYRLVVLPQAIRAVIPAIVGQFISLFKDTSLVIIIGLRELLGTARNVASQGEFLGLFREALVFIAVVYFVFSLTMSRESRRLEARLSAGEERRR